MSSLAAADLGYAVLAVLLVGAATRSVHRHTGPLLFDLVDADEMVVAGLLRLITVAHLLVGAGVAVALVPSVGHVPAAAMLSSLGRLLLLLAALHLGILALFFWWKHRRTERTFPPPVPGPAPARAAWPVLIPGATPPTVPMGPPVFHAPRGGLPPGLPVDAPVWTYPPPSGPRLAPLAQPPFPPPWCAPLPSDHDVWAPPRR